MPVSRPIHNTFSLSYGERVTEPGQIKDAIKRGIQKTKEGTPALLEFITEKATDVSRFP